MSSNITLPSPTQRVSAKLWWIAAALLCVAGWNCTVPAADHSSQLLMAAIVFFGAITAWTSYTNGDDKTARALPFMLVLTVFWSLLIWGFRSADINGERYFFLADDMMISMRAARNFADGLGLVWNPGEYLEVFTNLLWTLLMAGTHLLSLPDRLASVPIMAVSVIGGVICLPLAQRWAKALGANAATQALVMMAMMVNAVLTTNVVVAFEQTLIVTIFMASLLYLLEDIHSGAVRPWGFICLGLIPLFRMDAAILSVATGLWVIYEHPKRLKVISYLALAVVPSIVATLARHAYYGDWLPNTYYLKMSGWPDRWKTGVHYTIGFLRGYGWAFVLIALAWLRGGIRLNPAWRAVIIISGAQLAYGAYIGGDVLGVHRVFAAVVVLLLAAGFTASQTLFNNKLVTATIAIVAAALLARSSYIMPGLSEVRRQDTNNIALALKLNQEAPTALVADGYAGNLFYFAYRVRGIDVLGKTDAHVSHMAVPHKGTTPGHNKFDFDYSIGTLHPDYVVALYEGASPDEETLRKVDGNWNFPRYQWFNTAFREHCLPHPMPWNTWRTVFRCDWSNPTVAPANPS
ncbi:hypothetical protein [Stenotrophobium rhamnosiphilum]|uniref:Glycosyltransferase RgtA/B/C/D-like domain-containing protein n=1 Tax=Stenotrophobium rhamnosiphilum TaxID=2029166 RepID=A0A2T5MHD8_9GAMM|nr:hypothetical protein [Stenotrophobium rhamnosiphilum]PTU31990.1 hypothetical protein CJD38_04745 [Stenotrophobium rhamnosiphilum]